MNFDTRAAFSRQSSDRASNGVAQLVAFDGAVTGALPSLRLGNFGGRLQDLSTDNAFVSAASSGTRPAGVDLAVVSSPSTSAVAFGGASLSQPYQALMTSSNPSFDDSATTPHIESPNLVAPTSYAAALCEGSPLRTPPPRVDGACRPQQHAEIDIVNCADEMSIFPDDYFKHFWISYVDAAEVPTPSLKRRLVELYPEQDSSACASPMPLRSIESSSYELRSRRTRFS